jgi:hypothetical protein
VDRQYSEHQSKGVLTKKSEVVYILMLQLTKTTKVNGFTKFGHLTRLTHGIGLSENR